MIKRDDALRVLGKSVNEDDLDDNDNCIENIVFLLSKVPQILIITLLPWYLLSRNRSRNKEDIDSNVDVDVASKMKTKTMNDDIVIVLFAVTALFVALNRVCTAQYFTWFICIMPLLKIHPIYNTNIIIGVVIWLFVVLSWLCLAYQYEFEGESQNILRYVWVASILFQLTTCANVINILYIY